MRDNTYADTRRHESGNEDYVQHDIHHPSCDLRELLGVAVAETVSEMNEDELRTVINDLVGEQDSAELRKTFDEGLDELHLVQLRDLFTEMVTSLGICEIRRWFGKLLAELDETGLGTFAGGLSGGLSDELVAI